MKRKIAKQQVRLSIMSNAGGVGKTTLAVHLGYGVASRGYKVVIIELDPQGHLKQFVGIEQGSDDQSIAHALIDGVKKTGWNPQPVWTEHTSLVSVIQGDFPLSDRLTEIQTHKMGNYLLDKRLQESPLDADLIILDNNASIDLLGLMSLAASTHALIPLQCEYKAIEGAAKAVKWFYRNCLDLGLDPQPKLLGIVPSRVSSRVAIHGQIASALPDALAQFEETIESFPAVRDSNEIINASGAGLPLQLYRPKHPAIKDFEPIIQRITKLLEGKD